VFALFSSVCRLRRPLIGAAVAALALTFAAPVLTAAPAAISKAPKPGVAGAAITLASHVDIDDGSYDIAVDGAGTAYVGWIADLSHTNTASRTVYLCVLPLHARACKGGIHSTASLDMSGASDLKVLVTKGGRASMVWFDNVLPDAENGPEGGQITETTLQPNGTLSDAQFVAAAPSFGEMLDAELGPNGSIWTVAAGSEAVDKIQVHEGLSSSPISIKTPFGVDYARLAFNGTKPIIVIHKAGAITEPVAFSDLSSGSWTKFANVARTWTSDANFGLTSSKFGVRLIATVNNADYYPVVAKWNGHGFTKRTAIGDHNNNSPTSHDTVSDASGRIADVAIEGSQLAIDNLANTTRAAIVRVPTHGLTAGGIPQLGTTPRGDAWVAWSIEAGGTALGDKLMVEPILLPGLHRSGSGHGSHGSVTVTGPASCMPNDGISVGVSGHADRNWHVTKRTLKLGHKTLHGVLNGASLTPGKKYSLKGTVTFADGGSHSTVSASLKFRACPKP
jgi:hypothetical protein